MPISEVTTPLIEVRLVGRSGLDLLTHFDPEQKCSVPVFHWAPWEQSTVREVVSVWRVPHARRMLCVNSLE
jgi:hypothetical protein